MDNTIIIVLFIAVVIYLIIQSTPQREDFNWWSNFKRDWCHPSNRYRWMGGCR